MLKSYLMNEDQRYVCGSLPLHALILDQSEQSSEFRGINEHQGKISSDELVPVL